VVRRLCQGELARGRKLLLSAALLTLQAVAALLLAIVGRWGGGVFDQLLEVDLAFLAPFLPATLLGPAIAEEIERGTAGFLFVRPAPRAALLLGRLSAVLPALAITAVVSLAIGYAALYARFPTDLFAALPHLGAAMVSVLGALLLYSLLALGLGASFSKRPVAALLVLFLVDGMLARTPIALRILSPAHHLRALGGLPDGGTIALPFSVPVWGSAVYLILLIAGAALFGARRIERIEMTGDSA